MSTDKILGAYRIENVSHPTLASYSKTSDNLNLILAGILTRSNHRSGPSYHESSGKGRRRGARDA